MRFCRTSICLALVIAAGSAQTVASEEADCEATELEFSTRVVSRSSRVGPHDTVIYVVEAADHRPRVCSPRTLLFQAAPPGVPGFRVFAAPSVAVSKPGGTVRTVVSLTATHEAKPDEYRIPLHVRGWGAPEPRVELPVSVEPPPACAVDPLRELFIHGPSVVDDPVRTNSSGAWSFGELMRRAARTPAKAPEMVSAFLESWLRDQRINSFLVPARPAMQRLVLLPWPKHDDGRLDLDRSPLRLLAIVARLDLGDLAEGHAGELRFVFGLLSPGGHPSRFTLILEYRIPARSSESVASWARQFHELGRLPFPSERYNARLQALTDAVTSARANPHGVNGSTLSTLRTNENMLAAMWELRQFRLAPDTGQFVETTIDRTPDLSFRNHGLVARFINRNEAAILEGDYDVPAIFEEHHFLAGANVNTFPHWTGPGVENAEAQRQFSLNTCDGCHGSSVTGTDFIHVMPRKSGSASRLSGFLTGIALEDPLSRTLHTYNALRDRKLYVERLVCDCPGPEPCPEPKRSRHLDH